MSITSPLDLGPLVWVNPTAGSYTGSNLTSLANAGTVGGSFTVTGTIAKSTAIGSFTTLRMDDVSKQLTLTFAVASGALTIVYWGKLIASGALNGIMGKGWPGDGDAKAFYANTGSAETIAFANGCCSVDAGHAPSLDSAAGGVNDTSFHTMLWQVGATNALYRDNSLQTITGGSNASAPGAMPTTGSVSWNFGSTGPTLEPANADIAGILVFDFVLTSTQRNDLDTWIQGQAAGTVTASLAATDTPDTTAISAGLTSFATLAATEAKDTTAIAVGLTSFATLAATDAQDVASIAAGLTSFVTLAATEVGDTTSISLSAAGSSGAAGTGAGSHRIGRKPKKRKIKGVLEKLEAEQVKEVLPLPIIEPAASIPVVLASVSKPGLTNAQLAERVAALQRRIEDDEDEDFMLLAA